MVDSDPVSPRLPGACTSGGFTTVSSRVDESTGGASTGGPDTSTS